MMLCQICKQNTATVHLTEINNGQRTERHLCQDCAQKEGLTVKTQIPLNELLSTLLSAQPEAGKEPAASVPDHACPVCGMTLQRFSKESLLGCPNDYHEFEQELTPLIEQTQNGHLRHCGKIPSRCPQKERENMELNNLRRQLEAAVKNEDYETAAQLRDQMKSYE